MTIKEIIEISSSEEEFDNNCVDIFISDYIEGNKDFKTFPLSKYLSAYRTGKSIIDVSSDMKQKLARAREKGRGGWWQENCSVELLEDLLEEHKLKTNAGNEIDLCNFSMFIYFKKHKE